MGVVVGRFRVECIALGGQGPGGSRWTGQWSIYEADTTDEPDAVAEGVTDPVDTYAQAISEAEAEGIAKARDLAVTPASP